MSNSLDNVLTQIDVTGPNFDLTTLIPNRPLEKRGSGDSEYRDSLARSLKESSRQGLNTKSRRDSDSKSIRSDQSKTHTLGNQSSSTELKQRDVSKAENNDRASLKRPPTQGDHSDQAAVKPDENSETPDTATLTGVEEIPAGEGSDVLEGEHILKIQAEVGMPPAQFQPFIITTTLGDDLTSESEGNDVSYSSPVGLSHAHSVIENLINRFEISSDREQSPESETLIPPAGLFQALKALEKHEDASQKPNENNSVLPGELTIDSDSQNASLIDSVEFEVTVADNSSEIEDSVSTSQLESDATFQFEVSEDQSVQSEFSGNEFVGIQQQKTAGGNSKGEKSGSELPQQELDSQAVVLEGRVSNTVVNSATATEQSNESFQSVSNRASHVTANNSSDLSVGEISEKDHSEKIKASTKQTTKRLDVNPKKLVNRVAVAIRSAGQNGRPLRIRLQPPELGTLEIEVSSRNGVLFARLEVQTVSAQQSILENMSLLRDALAQNGTRLENIDVHLNERLNEGGQTDLSKEQQQQDEQQSEQERQQDDSDQTSDENESESRQQAVGIATQIDQLDIQI